MIATIILVINTHIKFLVFILFLFFSFNNTIAGLVSNLILKNPNSLLTKVKSISQHSFGYSQSLPFKHLDQCNTCHKFITS